MTEQDADSHRKFTANPSPHSNPMAWSKPTSPKDQPRTHGASTGRTPSAENIFALGHSERFGNIESAHPEIHAAKGHALSYGNDLSGKSKR